MVEEAGSSLAAKLWNSAYPVVSSILLYPEARAALAAARRAGRLTSEAYRYVVAEFEEKYEELVAIGVDQVIARSAGIQAESLGLRGYDAVHLATALDLGEEEVALITWDDDLDRAAQSLGLAVAGSFE
jgi:predicted nucleic acid-binding protein